MSAHARPSLVGLFLISLSATGVETALTRYFAYSKYSEYGYWVISIVMVGLALSGVAMALARGVALRHAGAILRRLPLAALVAGGIGYRCVTLNPFNPLQLQNSVTWVAQLGNIGLYYLALLPFFFLVGAYISLTFMTNETRIGRVYAADLLGAGAGAGAVVALAFAVPPFRLVPALLAPLGLACVWQRGLGPRHLGLLLAGGVAWGAVEAVLLLDDRAAISESKAIYAPLHTHDSRILAQILTPRGVYALLDDFTERADVDVSNDAGLMNLPGPPRSLGLYRDGARIASLPRDAATAAYAPALLGALPYLLRPHARVLLIGSGGGFRLREARALGAASIDALEPDPVIRRSVSAGLTSAAPEDRGADARVWNVGPLGLARLQPGFNVIDVSSDFLDQAEANQAMFSAEALAAAYRDLAPGGLLSLPVSIRDFPAYALKLLNTLRVALAMDWVADAAAHVAVYRSAWNVRILVSAAPWPAQDLAVLRKFCNDRSFDVVYYRGFDPVAARADIYNDLPPVSFATGEVDDRVSPDDALANEAGVLMAGLTPPSAADFDLRPIRIDRPSYYSLLRLDHPATLLRRLEILPQPEIAQLVNVAVLVQACLFALVVLGVPLLWRGRSALHATPWRGAAVLPRVVAFCALGLGFLFVEIAMIDRASLYLNDRALGFALVLTGMLIFSGLGSLISQRMGAVGFARACGLVALWCVIAAWGEQPLLLATATWPLAARLLVLLAGIAPVSVLQGMPFALLLSRSGVAGSAFLPWGWGLNGAMSVVATPLANLLALGFGFRAVLLCAALLYAICVVADPTRAAWWKKTVS